MKTVALAIITIALMAAPQLLRADPNDEITIRLMGPDETSSDAVIRMIELPNAISQQQGRRKDRTGNGKLTGTTPGLDGTDQPIGSSRAADGEPGMERIQELQQEQQEFEYQHEQQAPESNPQPNSSPNGPGRRD